MKHFNSSHSNNPQFYKLGVALIELCLVLPLLIVLIFSGIEFYRYIATKNRLILNSRDINIEVFKKCQNLPAGSATYNCIQAEVDSFYAQLSAHLPGEHVVVTQVFRAASPFNSTTPCPIDSSYTRKSSPSLPQPATRINTAAGSSLALLCAGNGVFDPSQEIIVSTEIHYKYEPIIGFIASLYGLNAGSKYVVAVI